MFSCEICEIFKNTFFYSTPRVVDFYDEQISPEENFPPTLILTLTLNETLTLTRGQFSSGAIFRTPF